MNKFYLASFNRASDGALEKLRKKLDEECMLTEEYKEADYIIAVGDRVETYDFVLKMFRENKNIVHLWAGEQGCWAIHDDVYRHSMTLMSDVQLCTNATAKKLVEELCNTVKKRPNAHVVGNVYLDSIKIDNSIVPKEDYDLVLYNPTTRSKANVKKEINDIIKLLKDKKYIWIEPNGDKYSDLVMPFVNTTNVPRPNFLGLLKNCRRFITNSSCMYFEAPFLISKNKIIPIGKRNIERGSKYADMGIPNASDNILRILKGLR